jgi:hypothetical protein
MSNHELLSNFYRRAIHSDKKLTLEQKNNALQILFNEFKEITTQKEAHDIVRSLANTFQSSYIELYHKGLELLISKLKSNVYLKSAIISYILKHGWNLNNFKWLCDNVNRGYVLTNDIFQSLLTNKLSQVYTLLRDPNCSKTFTYKNLFENKTFITYTLFYKDIQQLTTNYNNNINPNQYKINMDYLFEYLTLNQNDQQYIFNQSINLLTSLYPSPDTYTIMLIFINYYSTYNITYSNDFIGYFYFLDIGLKKYNIKNKKVQLKSISDINLYEISLRLLDYKNHYDFIPIFTELYNDYKCEKIDQEILINLLSYIGINLFCKIYTGSYDDILLGKLILSQTNITKTNFIDKYLESGGVLTKRIYNLVCSMKKIELIEIFFQNKFIPSESDIEMIRYSTGGENDLIKKILLLFNTYSIYISEKSIIHVCKLLNLNSEQLYKTIMPYTIYHDDEKKFNQIISSYVTPRMSLLNLPINRLIGSLHDILPVDPLIYKLTKSEINSAPYEQQKILLEIVNKYVQNIKNDTKIDTKIDSKLNTEISFKKIVKKNNPTQVFEIAEGYSYFT